MVLLSGNAHTELAEAIALELDTPVAKAEIGLFSEGETRVVIHDDVRGEDVFVLQPTGPPSNQNLMELLVMVDAIRRGSASRITAVMPYFGYARQDRKDQPRVPITAKLVANLLTAAGFDRILTLDLHSHQIQGFFDIPLDHLYASGLFTEKLKQEVKNPIVVSPDVGAVKMAQGVASKLDCDLAIIDKRRVDDKNTKVNHVVGDVAGFDAIIVDDIVATAGSLCEGARTLKEQGATSVCAAISHGILSGPAIDRIKKSDIDMLYVTDSIPLSKEKQLPNIKQVSIAPLMANAIERIHHEKSVSKLFS